MSIEGGAPQGGMNSALQSLIANGGGGGGGVMGGDQESLIQKLLFMFPSLHYNSILDIQQLGIGKFLNTPMMVVGLNASNPNGLLSRILRALQLDKLMGGPMQALAQREQQEYDQAVHISSGAHINPLTVPDVTGGGGREIG